MHFATPSPSCELELEDIRHPAQWKLFALWPPFLVANLVGNKHFHFALSPEHDPSIVSIVVLKTESNWSIWPIKPLLANKNNSNSLENLSWS